MTSQTAMIGQRMREVREKTGYSQGKFAAMLELSDRAYKNYELGKREPPVIVLMNFANTFKIDIRWLIFGDQLQSSDQELVELACATSEETYRLSMEQAHTPLKVGKYVQFFKYVLNHSVKNQSSPQEEAKSLYGLIQSDD